MTLLCRVVGLAAQRTWEHRVETVDEGAWDRWLAYRKAIRKPIKAVSVESARRRLAKFGTDQAAVVEQSIANGWQGLFELKDRSNGKSGAGRAARTGTYERTDESLRKWAAERGLDPSEI